jgi:putative MATE family efflux protein
VDDRRELAREIRRLAIPAITNSLLQTLVLVVDRAMLGHHGEAALAAMQIGGAVEWSLWSVFSSFQVGTIACVGALVGKKKPRRAWRAALASLAMALFWGTIVLVCSRPLMVALPVAYPLASPAVMDHAQGYLTWTLGASPLVFAGQTIIAVLQASGDTKTPLYAGAAANVVHIAINWVLIPSMGTRGAGVSTAITFTLEGLFVLVVLLRRAPKDRARRLTRLVRARIAVESRRITKIAMPAVFERVLYHVGYLAFVAIIARLGDDVMAANQALLSLEAICWLSGDGFGIAAAALVAQKRGAGAFQDAYRAARASTLLSVMALTCLGLVFLGTGPALLHVFSSDPAVLAIARSGLPIFALAQPFMATGIVLAQSLRGGGFTRPVLMVSALCAFVVRLVAAWSFAVTLNLGLVGVWLGSTTDWAVRSVLLVGLTRMRLGER